MNSQKPKQPTKQQPPKIRAIFTQLLRTEKPFGNQFAKFSYHLTKYQYIAELFTNVKLRADQIPAYIRHLSDTMRRIINCDVRYRQRMDDLPCAVGCRAFGVAPLGGGWYSPNIKVACSNARVLEYICRQWCKRTTQYPHTLDIIFDTKKTPAKGVFFVGGGGGSRTRVQTRSPKAFYTLSRHLILLSEYGRRLPNPNPSP